MTAKEFWDDLIDVSVTEWWLCLMCAVFSICCTVLSGESKRYKHLEPFFLENVIWYLFRSFMPVAGWLADKHKAAD